MAKNKPDITNPIPKEIVNVPEVLCIYSRVWPKNGRIFYLATDLNGKITRGVWIRILADDIKGNGHIDDKTPEFAISVYFEYKNKGIGELLIVKMISDLIHNGFSKHL